MSRWGRTNPAVLARFRGEFLHRSPHVGSDWTGPWERLTSLELDIHSQEQGGPASAWMGIIALMVRNPDFRGISQSAFTAGMVIGSCGITLRDVEADSFLSTWPGCAGRSSCWLSEGSSWLGDDAERRDPWASGIGSCVETVSFTSAGRSLVRVSGAACLEFAVTRWQIRLRPSSSTGFPQCSGRDLISRPFFSQRGRAAPPVHNSHTGKQLISLDWGQMLP